jgi:CspA family cold shock protein
MSKGTVKWFDSRMGFGFIETEKTGDEVFLHFQKQVGKHAFAIAAGDRVEFDTKETPRGLQATVIRKLDLTAIAE